MNDIASDGVARTGVSNGDEVSECRPTPLFCEPPLSKLSSWERFAREEGVEEGLEKGLEKGLLNGIETSASIKFGAVDPSFLQELKNHKAAVLSQILEAMKSAATLDELRQLLPAKNGSVSKKADDD